MKIFCRHKYVCYASDESFIPLFGNWGVCYTGKRLIVYVVCAKCLKRKEYKIKVNFTSFPHEQQYPDIVYKVKFEREKLALCGKMLKKNIPVLTPEQANSYLS